MAAGTPKLAAMIERSIEEATTATELELERLGRGPGARELALTKTKLEEAAHWLHAAEKAIADGAPVIAIPPESA